MTRQIKLLLILSLLLNVLFGGIIGGHALHRFGHRWGQPEHTALASLPPASQEAVRSAMRTAWESSKPTRQEMQTVQDRMRALLLADSFDEAAYDKEAQKLQALRGRQTLRTAHAFKVVALKLNLQERKALAESLKNMPREKFCHAPR